MTCPSLLRRRPGATDDLGDLEQDPAHSVGDVAHELAHTAADQVRRDDALGQFIRFVLVGGSSTAVYALLFLGLQGFGYLAAHVAGTVVSSVLANELHRRLTFRADERVGWLTAQLEAGGVSLFGLVATSVALGWLDSATGSAPAVLQITLVAAVTGFIGLIRFIALRWIFRPTEAVPAR
ncbi:GtrA family protein [Blastococcus haudaquaticus]|uniref:Flippase GtrA (Transmembrane translocase of bactoprenol-linked glucose) n=1 Tax=Blastococcus haudaquaticus TaxID=1938745 RepID=A0A286GG26_9ACTN|nr:GtrA family protein [Blastococcus haudaquaticus]SOD94442.1 Putative flippase GtrA (transmembrane translocase of bactoprenol-linked glucose) [Blastococcus haudaquaticus]